MGHKIQKKYNIAPINTQIASINTLNNAIFEDFYNTTVEFKKLVDENWFILS